MFMKRKVSTSILTMKSSENFVFSALPKQKLWNLTVNKWHYSSFLWDVRQSWEKIFDWQLKPFHKKNHDKEKQIKYRIFFLIFFSILHILRTANGGGDDCRRYLFFEKLLLLLCFVQTASNFWHFKAYISSPRWDIKLRGWNCYAVERQWWNFVSINQISIDKKRFFGDLKKLRMSVKNSISQNCLLFSFDLCFLNI